MIKLIILSAALFLFSCSSVQIKNQSDLCSDQRLPSSEKVRCLSLFESNLMTKLLEKSDQFGGGLSQTTFTSSNGLKMREGPAEVTHDEKQIVSFFTETNTDGSPNRGGVMVQGTPTEIIFDDQQKPAYMSFAKQRVRLLEYNMTDGASVIKGQGYAQHPEGFSSPIGFLKGWKMGIAEYSIRELKSLFEAMTQDGVTTLEFESGVIVKGEIEKFTENTAGNYGSPTVITFKKGTCRVTFGKRTLFAPSWGTYDMIFPTVISETNARSDSPIYNPEK